jgi:hypothetical protein
MEKAGDLIIQRKQTKRAEMIELVREKREAGQCDLMYNARPFVLTGLPLKKPSPGVLKHERRNGNIVLQVVAHPDYGLPWGQDRIVPLWVTTLAVQTGLQTVRFRSAKSIIREFGLPDSGQTYRRLIDAFRRIMTSTIFFGTEQQFQTAAVWEWQRFHYFDKIRLWFSTDVTQQLPEDEEFANVIQISDEFWRELQLHKIPVDANMVRGLINNPGALDLATFLIYRCFTATAPTSIPLFGRTGLIQQIGSAEYSRERRFREILQRWLDLIHPFWPECPAKLSGNGNFLKIEHAKAIPQPRVGAR